MKLENEIEMQPKESSKDSVPRSEPLSRVIANILDAKDLDQESRKILIDNLFDLYVGD